MKKGTYGYIKKKKSLQFFFTIGLLLLALAIFLIGYYLNNEQKNNVFTIIAVLMVLPASKAMTSFIVVAPFKTPIKENYSTLSELISSEMILLTDLVITSTEKVMNLDYVVVMEDNVIGVIGKPGQDVSYIESYLAKGVKNVDNSCHVKIFKDYKSFLNRIETVELKQSKKEMNEKIKSYILTLAI